MSLGVQPLALKPVRLIHSFSMALGVFDLIKILYGLVEIGFPPNPLSADVGEFVYPPIEMGGIITRPRPLFF